MGHACSYSLSVSGKKRRHDKDKEKLRLSLCNDLRRKKRRGGELRSLCVSRVFFGGVSWRKEVKSESPVEGGRKRVGGLSQEKEERIKFTGRGEYIFSRRRHQEAVLQIRRARKGGWRCCGPGAASLGGGQSVGAS